MKPTSIIFLCLAVLFVVGGIVTCYIASGMADEAGIELFEASKSAGGDKIEKKPLDDEALNKISLILKDADVTVRGGADETYIELVNFGANSYSYTIKSGILTVDESIGFLSLLNFSEKSVSFGGLRQYLKWRGGKDEGRRAVNIYLSNNYSIKQIEIKADNGNVTVDKAKNRADYSFNIKRGSLLFSESQCNSAVAVDMGTGGVTFRDSSPAVLDVAIKRGDFKFYVQNYAYQSYGIITDGGTVYLADEEKGESLSASTPMAFIKVTAKLDGGDAYIGAKDPGAQPAETTGGDTSAIPGESAAETTSRVAP